MNNQIEIAISNLQEQRKSLRECRDTIIAECNQLRESIALASEAGQDTKSLELALRSNKLELANIRGESAGILAGIEQLNKLACA